MPHQVALTVRAPVRRGHTEALRTLLDGMSADPASNPWIPFGQLPATHFGRLLLVEGGAAGPTLLLMLDCDAPLEQRIDELVQAAGAGLDELFQHCDGYPDRRPLTAELRRGYLESKLTNVAIFYVHAIGRSLEQIRQEAALRRSIERYLDKQAKDLKGRTPTEIRGAIQAFVRVDPTLAWALQPAERPGLAFRLREQLHKVAVPLLLLVFAPLLIPALLAWLILLRYHEMRDPPPSIQLDPVQLRKLSDLEDIVVQNAISTIAPVKPGLFWQLNANLFFAVGDYSARHVFGNGSLAGLTTVHFARFMRLDRGQRILFTSYYDGSLESYMNDFIDQVAWVLNSMFGSQDGYPTTRWLFLAGARDARGFKRFIRGRQIPTQVWYSAYGELTAVNVDNNARIRAGLYGSMSPEQAEAWLRRL